MKVAICLDRAQIHPDSRAAEYTRALVESMMDCHPETEFLYIPGVPPQPPHLSRDPGQNIRILNGPASNPRSPVARLLQQRLVNRQIRNFSPRVLLATTSFATWGAPVTLLFPELFYPGRGAGTLRKATRSCSRILCLSERAGTEILRLAPQKTMLVVPAAARPGFHPLSLEERMQILATHTGGMEYLVCPENLDLSGFLWVLKSFSGMKQKVSTRMKLLFTRIPSGPEKKWRPTLDTFHFRTEVLLAPGSLPEATWIAAAYAMILPSGNPAIPLALAEAMACGVPALVPDGWTKGDPDDGALLRAGSIEEASACLTTLYLDEKLRTRMSRIALDRSASRGWKGAGERLWECLAGT